VLKSALFDLRGPNCIVIEDKRIMAREKASVRVSNSGPKFCAEFNELLFIPVVLKLNWISEHS
jgi:hypothetical protein